MGDLNNNGFYFSKKKSYIQQQKKDGEEQPWKLYTELYRIKLCYIKMN